MEERDYKFRYVFKHKEHDTFRYEFYDLNDIEYMVGNEIEYLKEKGYELLSRDMFTGQTDVNNVDIYEKDILTCENGHMWVVSFDERGCFIAHEPKGVGRVCFPR